MGQIVSLVRSVYQRSSDNATFMLFLNLMHCQGSKRIQWVVCQGLINRTQCSSDHREPVLVTGLECRRRRSVAPWWDEGRMNPTPQYFIAIKLLFVLVFAHVPMLTRCFGRSLSGHPLYVLKDGGRLIFGHHALFIDVILVDS